MELNKEEIIGKALINYCTRKNYDNLPDLNVEQFCAVAGSMLSILDEGFTVDGELFDKFGEYICEKLMEEMIK